MNAITVKCKKQLTRGVHYLQDKLGLPVNYTDLEFASFKESLDWSSLSHDRVSLLSMVFASPPAQIQRYIGEAEEIVIEEKNELSPHAFQGVGNPMGRTDRITLYGAIRAAKPKVVVETGTAAGASATYILHTYVHMMAEYELLYPHLRDGGVMCSHDVLLTNAWKHFVKRYRLLKWGMVKNLGICVIEK